jgi:hypothetical protein
LETTREEEKIRLSFDGQEHREKSLD